MERLQKIEIIFMIIVLVFNLFFFVSLVNSGVITGFAFFGDEEVEAPYDFVKEEQIKVDDDKVIFELEDAVFSRYTNSESMYPVLGEGATGVGFRPESENDIHVGDIISFKQGENIIVHRVVEKGKDEIGIYFVTKGDNNDAEDNKIRFSQIDSVLVGIIY